MASLIFKWMRRCLLMCVCAFFLMSHNAFATDAVINVTPTGSGLACMSWVNPVDVNAPTCNVIQNSSTDLTGRVEGINVTIGGTYYSDSVMELSFTFYRVSNTTSLHSIVNGVRQDNSIDTGWDLIGNDYSQLDANTGKLTLLFKHRVNSGNFNARLRGNYGTLMFALQPSDRVVGANYTIYAINNSNAGSQQIVDAINSMPNYSNNLNQINNGINNINNSINNINDNVEDATQDAADEAADSGDQSAADAENATAGLISVIGGFVNAITSASPTNCKINGKINNSFNMGDLDLCSMPVPPFVQIISSLILIAICIPFAIVMFNRFIGLFRSFQG